MSAPKASTQPHPKHTFAIENVRTATAATATAAVDDVLGSRSPITSGTSTGNQQTESSRQAQGRAQKIAQRGV